jgi:hypothetical protein
MADDLRTNLGKKGWLRVYGFMGLWVYGFMGL